MRADLTDKLRDLLLSWQHGEISAQRVHEEAEQLLETVGRPNLPETDRRAIPLEVVSQLDILNHQLITVDDIPVILEFLETPPEHELQAWSRWQSYWGSINYEARKGQLQGYPYYCT
jgi:hypothetical protein